MGDGEVPVFLGKPPRCWEKPLSAASRWVVCLLITGLMPCYYQEKFLNLIMRRKQL